MTAPYRSRHDSQAAEILARFDPLLTIIQCKKDARDTHACVQTWIHVLSSNQPTPIVPRCCLMAAAILATVVCQLAWEMCQTLLKGVHKSVRAMQGTYEIQSCIGSKACLPQAKKFFAEVEYGARKRVKKVRAFMKIAFRAQA